VQAGATQLFTRRTGAWRVELLPGWDAIEDLAGVALVSRQPFDEAGRFRASVNVVEVAVPLPPDLHEFVQARAATLVETGGELKELYCLPEADPAREPGVLAAGFVVSYRAPHLGLTIEQVWADADQGSLAFTLMAEADAFERRRPELLSVPRSLELRSQLRRDN
jgi:hypothetical protein